MPETVKTITAVNITVVPKLPVLKDKNSGVKSVSFPFMFDDGVPGFVTVTRMVKKDWEPADNLKDITINFS